MAKPLIIDHEDPKPFDVDGCLIIHTKNRSLQSLLVFDCVEKRHIAVRPNWNMVRLLREEKHRGSFVMVWSRGGKEWATEVVRALGLMDYVDLIMTKPKVYFDDTEVKDWLKDRVFMGPDEEYKIFSSVATKE